MDLHVWCLNKLIAFYDKIYGLVDEVSAMNVADLGFSKVFDIDMSKHVNGFDINIDIHNILMNMCTKYGLNIQKIDWNRLKTVCKAQRVVSSGTKSSCRPVTGIVLRSLILSPILFYNFINELNDGTEYTLNNFADDNQTAKNDWYTRHLCCHFRGTLIRWINGQTGMSWFQQRKMFKSYTWKKEEPHVPGQAGDKPMGKQLCRNGPMGYQRYWVDVL